MGKNNQTDINIIVHLLGPYARIAGLKEINMRFPEIITISQFFIHLSEGREDNAKWPQDLISELMASRYVLAVNGNYVHFSDHETTYLGDGDVISIIPAITGGS